MSDTPQVLAEPEARRTSLASSLPTLSTRTTRVPRSLSAKLQYFRSRRPTLFLRSLALFSIEALINLCLWIVTLIVASRSSGNFTSLAAVAYFTGLRHGLDADHICAIDNATRRIVAVRRAPRDIRVKRSWKSRLLFWRRTNNDAIPDQGPIEIPSAPSSAPLLQQAVYQRPLLVGLWFSLGHSTVVIIVTIAVSVSLAVASRLDGFGSVGNVVGPAIAGSFLFLVALGNSIMLARAWRARKRMMAEAKSGETPSTISSDGEQGASPIGHASEPGCDRNRGRFMGLLTRLTLPLLKAVTRPHHMYVVGALFGLGFDTASTIALLSVSASAGLATGSNAKVILLALLFTAGMTWVDCCDSILMVWAYAPPDKGQAGGGGSKKWWALFEEKPSGPQAGTERAQDEEDEGGEQVDSKGVGDQGHRTKKPSEGEGEEAGMQSLQEALEDQGIASLSKEMDTAQEKEASKVEPGRHLTAPPAVPLASLSSSAQSLSHLLTLLSILLAFTISIIVLMGLIASECPKCSRSLELHRNPETQLRLTGEKDNVITQAVVVNDGGLAGRWWNFWDMANEQSGYIGAGIVGCFLVLTTVWWTVHGVLRRQRKSRERFVEGQEQQGSPMAQSHGSSAGVI